jgi:hypothetical protein
LTVLVPKLRVEKNKLKQNEEHLLFYKKHFTEQINQVKSLAERKEEIINKISGLSAGVQDQINVYKSYINNNKTKEITYDNVDNLIKISDQEALKVIGAEATLEDFLFYIKKAFEKKLFNFAETIKLTRIYSRELYKIKAYRDKTLKGSIK